MDRSYISTRRMAGGRSSAARLVLGLAATLAGCSNAGDVAGAVGAGATPIAQTDVIWTSDEGSIHGAAQIGADDFVVAVDRVGLFRITGGSPRLMWPITSSTYLDVPVVGSERVHVIAWAYSEAAEWSTLAAISLSPTASGYVRDFDDVGLLNGVAVHNDGRAVITSHQVRFLDLHGEESSEFSVAAEVLSAPTAAPDGVTYVASWGMTKDSFKHRLWAFLPNGDPFWQAPLALEHQGRPFVSDQLILVPSTSGVTAFDPTGNIVWQRTGEDSVLVGPLASIAYAADTVVVSDSFANVYGLAAQDGSSTWTRNLRSAGLVSEGASVSNCLSPADARIAAVHCTTSGCSDSTLTVLDVSSGTAMLTAGIVGQTSCPEFVTPASVLVGTSRGQLIRVR